MKLTIAICTWNRAEELKRLLNEFEKCVLPANCDVNLLIVDNNSTDNTKQVVSNAKLPFQIDYFLEKRQGLSFARNTALEQSKNNWILFTDDDVSIKPSWVANWCDAISKLAPEIAFAGGAVSPRFLKTPSIEQIESIPMIGTGFCGIDLPQDYKISIDNAIFPMGANFAINKAIVNDKKFNTLLGVSGNKRLLGEEHVYMRELVMENKNGEWVEGVELEHIIPEERLLASSLKQQLVGMGRTKVLEDLEFNGQHNFPKWVVRALFENMIKMQLQVLAGKKGSRKYWKSFSDAWHCYGWTAQHISGIFSKK
ncbi:MAG: glycosyltransferase [Glaciecola sp.]